VHCPMCAALRTGIRTANLHYFGATSQCPVLVQSLLLGAASLVLVAGFALWLSTEETGEQGGTGANRYTKKQSRGSGTTSVGCRNRLELCYKVTKRKIHIADLTM
jgi:hypothetical protein